MGGAYVCNIHGLLRVGDELHATCIIVQQCVEATIQRRTSIDT